MGTRADFYVGRGEDAEWLGSIAWDGYPAGVFAKADTPEVERGEYLPDDIATEDHWCQAVAAWLGQRRDGTNPRQGWPWPWNDSRTTDYAYALDGGEVWASCFGRDWFKVAEGEPDDEDFGRQPKTAVFPDMTARKNVTYGSRSGVMLLNSGGPIPAEQIDAQEAAR